MPTDVPKLWCAVAFAAAPLPPPWKQSPQGYQNTLSGAISAVHPLLRAYQRVPRKFHEEPPNAKLLHLRWMEFAPPPEAEGFADGSAPATAQNGAAQNGAALERRAGSPTIPNGSGTDHRRRVIPNGSGTDHRGGTRRHFPTGTRL